jgi:hypothetical protein
MSEFHVCAVCQKHVKLTDEKCPFCGAARVVPAPSPPPPDQSRPPVPGYGMPPLPPKK